MPVVGEAGNRITWNRFFFVGRQHRQELSMLGRQKSEFRSQNESALRADSEFVDYPVTPGGQRARILTS
jgi:hypothetical protein